VGGIIIELFYNVKDIAKEFVNSFAKVINKGFCIDCNKLKLN